MTIEDIKLLIKGDEHRTLELKKTTGELKDGMKSLCAFLNTEGGWLFFGITPKLEILGQYVTDSTQREIAKEITKIEPAIKLPLEIIEVSKTYHFRSKRQKTKDTYLFSLKTPCHNSVF